MHWCLPGVPDTWVDILSELNRRLFSKDIAAITAELVSCEVGIVAGEGQWFCHVRMNLLKKKKSIRILINWDIIISIVTIHNYIKNQKEKLI